MKTNTQTFEDILKNTVTPWGEVGYITYKRTYSRRLKEDDPTSPTEEFPQTVKRVVEACRTQLKVGFTEEEEKEFAQDLLSLKGSVAGRFWWQLGTRTVKQLGLLSLQNCAYTTINHPVDPFVWAMDALMLGSGVGFSIQREHVYQMPKVKSKIKIERKDTNDADYIVPDSREGWVKLLGRVLKAHFYGGQGFSYSTICIRGKGAPIKGFGGTASGPEELCWGINEIHKILNSRAGQKLRPIDCLDIMNIIGAVVVAGNVRRSALICIGDSDDLDYLKAKRWDLGTIPNWRSMSNNSVYCADTSKLPNEFWETYQQGEPYGLINIDLARKVGRLGETQYPDNCVGFNPCQPEFATVLTKEGVKQFKDIQIGTEIWSKEGWTKVVNKWSTGVKPVNAYHTTGGVFVGTSNHRVDTRDGKIEVQYADSILTLSGPFCPVEERVPPDTYTSVKEVEYLGEHEVFDITVDNQSHTYWTGGLSVSNCAEQGLADWETCSLAELFLPNIKSKEELFRVARNLYRVNKHALRLGCHLKQTEEIVHKNMRMGIGVTGVWQATDEQRGWLSDCYEYLREYDIEYSDVNGWPVSIKLTTTKPSGTLSLLAGVTPGAHPSPAGPYYIRRIRMAADSPLVALCRKNGYDVEYQRNFDKSNDKTTMVVSFPCSVPESTPIGGNISAITQLEMVKYMQTVWSDNAVSVTVYYRLDELDEIRAWLTENYAEGLKTVSFLLYHGHGFDQAPYETITKEAYETMKAKVTPITALSFVSEDSMEIEDCATGACPIK